MNKQKGLALSQSKGFTIIELIVVIAIIAILAAIVLVNLTPYINKGRDSAVRGELANLIINSAVWYDGTANAGINGKYSDGTLSFIGASSVNGTAAAGALSDCAGSAGSGWVSICKAIVGSNANTGYSITFNCNTANCQTTGASNWCAIITLKSITGTYCVDSTGNKLFKSSGGACGTTGVCS